MLSDLVKEIITKLIKWIKSTNKKLNNLIESLKEVIHTFVSNIKSYLIDAEDVAIATVATAIIGPIFGTLKKVWMILKQGWSSLRSAISCFKDLDNKNKPIGIRMMEAGKIIIAGATGVGALFLGEIIEKSLMIIPGFALEIPLLGSLANILGIFFGAVISGIVGAIAINQIEKLIEKRLRQENLNQTLDKQNQVLRNQEIQMALVKKGSEAKKEKALNEIVQRHKAANNVTQEILEEIFAPVAETNYDFDKMQSDLESLL